MGMAGQPRVPRGVPTGGRFAHKTHDEVDLVLEEARPALDADRLAELGFDDMRLDMEYHRPPASATPADPEPEPEPIPAVPSGPVYGPAEGSAAPVDIIDWPTNQKVRVAKLRETIEAVGRLHGIRPSGFAKTALVLGSNKGGGKGGHWSPAMPEGPKPRQGRTEGYYEFRQRLHAWKTGPRRPEIRINTRSGIPGEEQFFMLHELGHRMDCEPPPTISDHAPYHSKTGYQHLGPEAAAAWQEFKDAAAETSNIKDAYSLFRGSRAFVGYHRSVHEVWARAYCQWACNQIGGDARKALEASQATNNQWSDEEFEQLAPLVEKVLRTTGAMRPE